MIGTLWTAAGLGWCGAPETGLCKRHEIQTTSTEAWLAFLEAERLPWNERGDAYQRTLDAYQRVLELDPKFVRAYIRMHDRGNEMASSGGEPRAVAGARSMKVLQAALRVDPKSAEVYGRLASAAALLDDVEAMRRYAQRALEIDPNEVAAHHWMAEISLTDGNIVAVLAHRKLMVDTNPLITLPRQHYAEALRLANRPAAALEVIDQWLALHPNSAIAQAEKAKCLLLLGRRDDALELARRRGVRSLLALHGTPADLNGVQRLTDLHPHVAATVQMVLGQPDAMVDHLEADHSDYMARARVLFDPEYDRIRSTPKFKAWLDKYRLTEAHERAQVWRAANPVSQN